jgi:hypothetical protein
LNESGTRFYNDLEVECLAELDLLIDEISQAALEAIEQAAGEAAKAATLASIEREATMLRDVQYWQMETRNAKQAKLKTAVITGIIAFLAGFTTGIFLRGVTK